MNEDSRYAFSCNYALSQSKKCDYRQNKNKQTVHCKVGIAEWLTSPQKTLDASLPKTQHYPCCLVITGPNNPT